MVITAFMDKQGLNRPQAQKVCEFVHWACHPKGYQGIKPHVIWRVYQEGHRSLVHDGVDVVNATLFARRAKLGQSWYLKKRKF